MVYPGSSHTRFEHSLGVMEMGTRMFDSLYKKNPDLFLEALSIKPKDKNREEQIKKYRRNVRIAALLHDVGHSPFSHAGEELFESSIRHEQYSVEIIRKYFKDILEKGNVDVEQVVSLITETEQSNSVSIFLTSLISGQLDADRADYLLRDSYHLGVKYGVFDKDIFIESMNLGKKRYGEGELDFNFEIGIDKKAHFIGENIIYARYLMLTQVYFHKVRRIYDYHVLEATKEVFNQIGISHYPNLENLDDYIKYDDWLMLGYFAQGKGGKHGEKILNRKHDKCVYSTILFAEADKDEKDKLTREKKKYENKFTKIDEINSSTVSFYKITDDISLIDENKNQVSYLSKNPDSKIVNEMLQSPSLTRIYIERE